VFKSRIGTPRWIGVAVRKTRRQVLKWSVISEMVKQLHNSKGVSFKKGGFLIELHALFVIKLAKPDVNTNKIHKRISVTSQKFS